MPSTIATFGELDQRLHQAIEGVRRAAEKRPDVEALRAIGAQLERLHGATRGGTRPPQALRDELDFGQIASRHLHPIEPALARDLYEIASWVAYA